MVKEIARDYRYIQRLLPNQCVWMYHPLKNAISNVIITFSVIGFTVTLACKGTSLVYAPLKGMSLQGNLERIILL